MDTMRPDEHHQVWEGGLYVMRDVWRINGTLVTCQYKQKIDGIDVWVDCPEGVMFADIKPYEVVDGQI